MLIYHQENGNKNQHKKIKKHQRKQNNMVQSAIFNNCENKNWQEVLQVNQRERS